MGLNLVGYYQACERVDDTALAPVGERVAGKLKDGFKNAVALVVRQFFRNSRLHPHLRIHVD